MFANKFNRTDAFAVLGPILNFLCYCLFRHKAFKPKVTRILQLCG